MALGLIFGGCIILIYQKMKLQSKNYEILNKQKLRKKIYIYLPLTCFLFRNSLTTIYSRTIISSSSGMSCKSSVSKIAAEFSPFVFLPLSTRAYFKGRAYIKIILKNHARSYFAGRSYYRGNTVGVNSRQTTLSQCGLAHLIHRALLEAYTGRIKGPGGPYVAHPWSRVAILQVETQG